MNAVEAENGQNNRNSQLKMSEIVKFVHTHIQKQQITCTIITHIIEKYKDNKQLKVPDYFFSQYISCFVQFHFCVLTVTVFISVQSNSVVDFF